MHANNVRFLPSQLINFSLLKNRFFFFSQFFVIGFEGCVGSFDNLTGVGDWSGLHDVRRKNHQPPF